LKTNKTKTQKRRKGRIKYILAAAAMLFLLLPDALVNSMEITTRAFVAAIGIDTAEGGGYEATAQLILPQGSHDKPQAQDTVSAIGKTVKTAVDGISSRTGKTANLAHCKLLFLGKSVLEKGPMSAVNFFMRSSDVDNGMMIAAAESAKDTVEKLSQLEKLTALSLPDFFSQSRGGGMTPVATLKTFTEGYYAGTGDLTLPLIEMRDKPEQGDEEGESGEESPQAELSENLKTAVIKNGRLLTVVGEDESRALLWLDKRVSKGTLLLEGFDGAAKNLAFDIKSKRVRLRAAFKKGSPVMNVGLRLKLSLDETNEESYTNLSFNEKKKLLKNIETAIQEKINGEIQALKNQCESGGFDIMRINETFYRFQTRRHREYAAAGKDLVRDCRIEVKITAETKI